MFASRTETGSARLSLNSHGASQKKEVRMPLLQKSIRALGRALPKLITPKAHAAVDCSAIVLFLAGSALFWRTNKRAAIASLLCGVAEAGVTILTDYSGDRERAIGLPLHRKIDFGLSTMTATMPEFLAFAGEKEKAFFVAQSVLIAGVTAITDFEGLHSSAAPARPSLRAQNGGELETAA